MAEEMNVSDLKITIRQATHADLVAISDFIDPFVASGHLLRRTFDELEDLLGHFFVAVNETGQIMGCAALEIYSPKLAEIRSLAVSSDAQGYGVGTRLVDACVALARERKIFEIMAISAEDGFFKKCGFDYSLPKLRRAVFLQTRDEL